MGCLSLSSTFLDKMNTWAMVAMLILTNESGAIL